MTKQEPIRCTSTTRPHLPPYGTRVQEDDTGLIREIIGAHGSRWRVVGAVDAVRPAEYRALLAATDGLAREVVQLHRPEPDITRGDEVRRWRCEGCDSEGYDCEYPEWPCRTSELAAAHNHAHDGEARG